MNSIRILDCLFCLCIHVLCFLSYCIDWGLCVETVTDSGSWMFTCFLSCFQCFNSTALCWSCGSIFTLFKLYSDFFNWGYFIVSYNCVSLVFWLVRLLLCCFMFIFMWSVSMLNWFMNNPFVCEDITNVMILSLSNVNWSNHSHGYAINILCRQLN